MKYPIKNIIIPQEKRKDINDKCLYVIENGLSILSQTDIFNAYTGEGGLHGLSYSNYNSFHSYTEAKKEIEQGQFFTPHNICKFMVDCVKPSNTDITADLTSGMGNFANCLPVEENIYLNELDIKAVKIAKYLYPKANITAEDIRHFNPDIKFDIVFGNPPFNLRWELGKEEYLSQLYYCIKSSQLLKPAGLMVLIVPNSFLKDSFSDGGMIKEIDKHFNFICQFDLPADSFKNVGVNHFETKVMIFQKKSEHLEDNYYNTSKISITDITNQQADIIYNTYVKPVQEQKERIKSKLFFENLHSSDTIEDQEFAFKVKKLLYDIKRNPKVNNNYSKCQEYVNKYYTQKIPEGMKWQEWEKIRVTKNKVIGYLNRALKKQNEVEKDQVILVKNSYGLKLKGYSRKNKLFLSKLNSVKEMSFNDMVLNGNYPFSDKTYKKLVECKIKQYEQQSQSFKEMAEDNNIKLFLDNLVITDHDNGEKIRLNDIQKHDTNLILQKNYSYIQWSMGTGKTICSIAYMLYRKQFNNTFNSFVVAPSIAINNTWAEVLKNYKYSFIQIKTMQDINNIQEGDIVIITFNMLCKYQKQIKKYLKKINHNFTFVLDEADSICNVTSKRTKAVLNCFQRYGKYKLLLSGTSTRNNISEVYTAFQCLYNSSVNFISESKYIMVEDKITKDLTEVSNKNYMKPYPSYQKGLSLFKFSHVPQKITVFGVGQNTQDIYNADVLKALIDKSIITRTFEEIVGKKIYELIQDTVIMNNDEKKLYYKAINEFYDMKYLFNSTGNIRKDRMLEIIQQLNLLLDICSHPQTYKEYKRFELPSKYKKILFMLNKWNDERVAIGCRNIKAVECYVSAIRIKYPNRPLFIITGNSTTMKQRREICKRLQETTNGILVSTQQSLSSSMNIDFVDKVIIPDHSWNYATESQYFFRFIRLTSKNFKEVHFVSYENSLESNLQQLIICKEKLNMFMRDRSVENEEMYERFGVDFNLIDMLLSKERDSEGHVSIRWGEQQII